MALRLNKETIETIKSDSALWVNVCNELGIKPSSMNNTLIRNTTLTDLPVLNTISKYLSRPINDLVEEYIE